VSHGLKPERPLLRDRLGAFAFGVLWLGPLSWTALAAVPPAGLPTAYRDLCAVTCLFPTRPAEHVDQYVQLKWRGQPGWHDLDEREYFRLEPFGYRTRLDRYLSRWAWQRPIAQQELLRWIVETERARDPGGPGIEALRIGVRRVPLGTDNANVPDGRFVKPARRSVAKQVSWGDAVWSDSAARGRQNP
jgi:hypothetical protein